VALETLMVSTDGRWFLTVRERASGVSSPTAETINHVDAEKYEQHYRSCLLWPLEYVMVEVAQPGQRVRVRAGVFGSAPIYCRATADRLVLSWDLADFFTTPMAINFEVASHFLGLGGTYSAQHLCCGITMLTERASLFVEPSKARYCYPEAIEAPTPFAHERGEDPIATFGELLDRAISKRPLTASQVAVELSGGMDSATVASAVTSILGPISSRGILLSGEQRGAQVSRRERVIRRLGLCDETVNIDAYPPTLDLRPASQRKEYPHAELYLEAFSALWGSARSQGCEFLFTGVGGDELFPSYQNEREQEESRPSQTVVGQARAYASGLLTPRALTASRSLNGFDAPTGPVPVSALLAGMCQAPHLLRNGLWPVNFLSDPSVVAFCHRLPKEGRQSRDTMRRYLKASMGEDLFPRPYVKETFAAVLPNLISQQTKVIAAQLRDCALADMGLINQRAVLKLLGEVAATLKDAPTAPLVAFLWLERFVRQVR
jgi:asparagine synthase (glutamine-hydrolysing)